MKSEDAPAAAAAATNKAMKRLISLALILVFAVCMVACTPNNVLTPDTPDTPDTPVQDNSPAPSPENPEQSDQSQKEPENTFRYVSVEKQKNKNLMPTLNISDIGIENAPVKDLGGQTLTIYTAERDVFSVDRLDDKEWILAVADELGVKVKNFMQSDKTLYSSQAIAQKSGMSLDIVSTLITDMVPTTSLMKSAFTLKESAKTLPFSKRVFDLSGKKVFTGYGNAKMMWYNKDIIGDDKTYNLFEQNVWNTEALASAKTQIKDGSKNMIECSNWASFGSAAGVQATGITADGTLVCNLNDQNVINSFKTFSQLLDTTSTDKKTFKNGNTAFNYTDAPVLDKGNLGFVPLPSMGESGANVSELCGVGMGISKTIKDEVTPYALTFILLWSARYSEARTDALVFDYKLGAEKAEKYIAFAETNGGLYNCDRVISSYFTNLTMPKNLYGTPEVISEKYKQVFERTQLLNSKL